MFWENDYLISNSEKKRLTNTIYRICKKYQVNYPDIIKINKRLRANDGVYTIYQDGDGNPFLNEISLAHRHYEIFGMDSLIKVLKHEIAHHICNMQGKNIYHNEYFKDICLEIGACLGDDFAIGKYKHLRYEGIEVSFKWKYTCPCCWNSFYTRKKMNQDLVCGKCYNVNISDFIIEGV